MSPRAACRLERLGYETFDYVAGKQDWLAFALPFEGEARLVAGELAREVPTCHIDDALGAVRGRLADSPIGRVVVCDDARVVLGLLGRDAADAPDATPVAELMQEGPTTVRPSEEVDALRARMERAGVHGLVVTRPDGTLVGIFEHHPAHGHGE